MFGLRRRLRSAADAGTPSVRSTGHAVRSAEEIVHKAWAHELLRHHARLEFTRSADCHDRDTAAERLAAAQRDGDPRKIGAAHIALESALEAVRQSTLACDRIGRTLRAELDGKARVGKERAITSLVRRSRPDGLLITASRERSLEGASGASGSVREVRRPRWRLRRRPFRLYVRRAAGPGQP